jgi:hypothetical protein
MWIETDGSESTPPVDACPRLSLDVGPAPVNGTRRPCGEDSENSSTSYLRNEQGLKSNPYIGESVFRRPHMGVSCLAELTIQCDFST